MRLISGPVGGGWCGSAGFEASDFQHVHSRSGNHTMNLTERGGGQIIDEG